MALVDPDTLRSHALTSCRRLAISIAGGGGGGGNVNGISGNDIGGDENYNGKLSKAHMEELFATAEFAAGLFRLFDHHAKGFLQEEDVIQLAKYNFRSLDSLYSADLMKLLESSVHLASDAQGRLLPRDFQRAIGGQNLWLQVFRVLSSSREEEVTVDELMRFISNITASTRNQLSQDDLARFAAVFRKCAKAKDDRGLTRAEFAKLVSSKNKFFVDRAFDIFDRVGTGRVTLDSYTETLGQLAGNNTDGAIRFLFRIYDVNGDGGLEEAELLEALKASMEENGMNFDKQQLQDLTHALWEDAGKTADDGSDMMTFEDLKIQLNKHPGLASGLADSIIRWCSPPQQGRKAKTTSNRINLKNYLISNRNFLFFMFAFIGLNVALFVWRAYYFRNFKNVDGETTNFYYMFARANGYVLNLNSTLLLIFILRYTITLMRKLGLVTIFPLDQNIFLHMFTGKLIFFQAWFHGIMHFINFAENVVEKPVEFIFVNEAYFNGGLIVDGSVPNYNLPPNCSLANVVTPLRNITTQICGQEGRPYSYFQWMLTTSPGLFGLIPGCGCANVTGVVLIVVLTVMVVCSMPFVRRSGHFEIFYFSHLLYSVYFVVLIFHAPSCWEWLIVPLILFGLEGTYRLVATCTGYVGQSVITQGIILPSKVTGLVIKKPSNFRHSPGDWVFIKIPQIALFEWHPFTISSAPEEKEYFTLHIRGVGGWTIKLYKFFEEEWTRQEEGTENPISRMERLKTTVGRSFRGLRKNRNAIDDDEDAAISPADDDILSMRPYKNMRKRPSTLHYKRGDSMKIDRESGMKILQKVNKDQHFAFVPKPLTVYLDGPYGAPASDIFRAKHAVLIATGIGVTPFSSILQSIMHRFWESKQECPNCHHRYTQANVSKLFNLTKVDFFWINRDQRSFEWFVQLLSQLEIEQAEKGGALDRFLDMHMYMTTALQKTDMRAVGLQLALDLLHEKEKRDLVTGLKARTKAGRPNWDKVFEDLKAQGKGDITVFYCGNPALAGELQQKCEKFGFTYRKEVF